MTKKSDKLAAMTVNERLFTCGLMEAFERADSKFENARPGEPQLQEWGSWEVTIQGPASNRLTFYTEDKS